MLFWILATAAFADDADCRVSTEDYTELKQELRDLRRRAGGTLIVAGDAPECEDALEALEKNDPLLQIRLVEAPPGTARENVEHSLDRRNRDCGAVLEPGPAGWWLREVGDCGVAEQVDRHLYTVGTWMLSGASLRYTRQLAPGFSALVDLGLGFWDPAEPDRIDDPRGGGPLTWGLMGGFDANKDSLKGGYLGVRGGIERVGVTPGEVDASTVVQGIMGHRFVGKGATVQLGGGVMMRVPTGDYTYDREMELGPMAELRLGLAR